MKSSAVLNSRQERTAGSTSHFGSSKAVSGTSAILVGGSSCVAMATPLTDTANHMALDAASQRDASLELHRHNRMRRAGSRSALAAGLEPPETLGLGARWWPYQ